MKLEEIRSLKNEELKVKVEELKQELFAMRFKQASGQLENPGEMRTVRKNIARILTVIREREMVK
jgi:large subunit ribosomal protein L29